MANLNERAELHKTIWQIANDLRGSVDGWDFKNYVLGFLFYRFISEDLAAHLEKFEAEAGNTEFDYASISDDDVDDEAFIGFGERDEREDSPLDAFEGDETLYNEWRLNS
jgi:type I restriction enzyme M protein